MEIMFEKCLRDLLMKRRKTQSELAEYLCISTQAVSKWCRGENMPDIALLPKIASFLDVSVDDLLGVGESKKQEKIQEYRDKSYKLSCKGLVSENIELWRAAYREFPNDMITSEGLILALYTAIDEKYYDEILSLGERILKESTDERIRSNIIQIFCNIHCERGNKEKAKEYAQMMSYISKSREVLLSRILDGEEGIRHNLQLLLDCLAIIGYTADALRQNDNSERELQLHEFYLKMLELYFDDGFYGYFAFEAVRRHKFLARIYFSCRNDEQKTFEHLKAAVIFAKQHDSLPLSTPYTYNSTLLNGYICHLTTLSNQPETECESLLKFMHNPEFDSIRDRGWFKNIERELVNCY